MRKFSKREMLIFVVCLLVGTVLIGLGIAYVIELKQRILPSGQTSSTRGLLVNFSLLQYAALRPLSRLPSCAVKREEELMRKSLPWVVAIAAASTAVATTGDRSQAGLIAPLGLHEAEAKSAWNPTFATVPATPPWYEVITSLPLP